MKNLTLENIAKACNGSYHGSEAQANQEVQTAEKRQKAVYLCRLKGQE